MSKETEEQQNRKEHKDDGGVIARLKGKGTKDVPDTVLTAEL